MLKHISLHASYVNMLKHISLHASTKKQLLRFSGNSETVVSEFLENETSWLYGTILSRQQKTTGIFIFLSPFNSTLTPHSIHVDVLQAPQHPKNPTTRIKSPIKISKLAASWSCSLPVTSEATSIKSSISGSTLNQRPMPKRVHPETYEKEKLFQMLKSSTFL